jgi:hypothetical protein
MERPQPTEKPLTREELIMLIASFPAHERDLGPENEVFCDRITPDAGQVIGECPGPIERLADAILARLPTLDAAVVETVAVWLESLPTLDMEDVVADGGVTSGMVVQQEATVMARKLRTLLNAFKGVGR